jgi:hypothetical protein
MNTEKIRQSDVMAENGISAALICRVRDKYVTDAEWWKEGTLIYWTPEACARVRAALGKPTPQPSAPINTIETDFGDIHLTGAVSSDDSDSGGDSEVAGTPEVQAETTVISLVSENSEGRTFAINVPIYESTEPEILTARVLKRARNYRFVYASLDGERIAVLCPKKGQRNIVGKNVRVEKSTIEGETRYTLIP